MRKKNLDLIVVLLIAVLNVGLILLPEHFPFIGIFFALPLVFLLPGYALNEALFKYTSDDTRSLIVKPQERIMRSFPLSARLVFSIGLSLTIDIIIGLMINMLSIGLQQLSWVVALSFLTTIFTLVAVYRRRGTQGQQREHQGVVRSSFSISIYEYALFGLALVITISSIWYSTHSAFRQEQQMHFTQFWMVPSKQANDSCAVLIGVQSFETSPVTYHVVLTANGEPLYTWSSVVLAPHEEWYQSVPITSSNINTLTLDAQLYRANQAQTLYREAHLTLTSSGGGNGSKLQC